VSRAYLTPVLLPADPTNPLEAATKQYVDAKAGAGGTVIPPGCIEMYAGAGAPTGWLLCDGSAIPGGNTALIALVGANTPDLRGRFPVGVGTFATLRASDGLAEASRSPVHSHTVANVSHAGNTTSAGGSNQSRVATLNGNETGTHNHGGATGNMATTGIPYFGVNFIIKT
jgi:microcystin-dependent protein